ncbi:cytokinin dehydrogenase 3-like protein, partial [Tanacetum coccineum]
MNEDSLVGVIFVVHDCVTSYVVDLTVEMEKIGSLEDTIVLGSFPPLSLLVTTTAGNVPGKSSYANVTGKPSGKKVNFVLCLHPEVMGLMFMDGLDVMLENGPWFIRNKMLILKKWHPDENLLKEDVLVWVKLHGVPVTAFSEDSLSAIATKLDTPLMLDSYTSDMYMKSWGRSSYARVMIELRANVELKDNIVVAMLKITREGHYTYNVHVEYEWKPPKCSSCKVFGHIHEECSKNTGGAGDKKTVKKPSKTSRDVSKGVEPTIEVSNSNPFDVLNSVDNDVEFGTNGGTTKLVHNEATLSGSSFINVNNDGEFGSNTPIGEKIDKIERQICE